MSSISIFDRPFDDGTKAKLEIFQQYFEEWLPVFTSRKKIIWNRIQIFDFFAGQGCDSNQYPGSPLIILKTINSLAETIKNSKIQLRVVFNEKDEDSYHELCKNVNGSGYREAKECEIYNKDFKALFDENYEGMKNTANFLFLDQNGIKEITEEIFQKIIKLKHTDFLFFISSSFFKRFSDTPEFKRYFPSFGDISSTSYYHIHRKVLGHYKSIVPENLPYYLAPFSIKKGSNIYGLIFGTNHTLGIEKFLSVAWKVDKHRGEANFDIDNDQINERAPALFQEYNIPTKKQSFEKGLVSKILDKTLKTNRDVYLYTLSEGFPLKEASNILKRLKQERKIAYEFITISADLHKMSNIEAITVL